MFKDFWKRKHPTTCSREGGFFPFARWVPFRMLFCLATKMCFSYPGPRADPNQPTCKQSKASNIVNSPPVTSPSSSLQFSMVSSASSAFGMPSLSSRTCNSLHSAPASSAISEALWTPSSCGVSGRRWSLTRPDQTCDWRLN